MLSDGLRTRLSPATLIAEVEETSLRVFLQRHGDTQFLLVSLAHDQGDLRSGLATMAAVAGTAIRPSAALVTGLETVVGDPAPGPGDTSIPPPQVFDEDALAQLLRSEPHFAVLLRKRVTSNSAEGRICIGRSLVTDVVLQHGGVSKLHAWLEIDEDGVFYLTDAGSKNGTRVNDDPLEVHEMVRVRPGDRITLGSVDATLCQADTLWRALR